MGSGLVSLGCEDCECCGAMMPRMQRPPERLIEFLFGEDRTGAGPWLAKGEVRFGHCAGSVPFVNGLTIGPGNVIGFPKSELQANVLDCKGRKQIGLLMSQCF